MLALLLSARKPLPGITLAAALLASSGCGATSSFMHPLAGPIPLKAPADAALVVFLRPSEHAAAMKTTILDGTGKFLGDSLAFSYFATAVPAGDHVFVAWAENTAGLRATLVAGKTYYVEVAPGLGALSAKVQLFALAPRTEHWKDLSAWLAESSPLSADVPQGQAFVGSRGPEVQEKIRLANDSLKEYDQDELALHTLRAEDGQ